MRAIIVTGLVSVICWGVFLLFLSRDRSRYRNCYLLFIALVSVIPFLLSLAGPYRRNAAAIMVMELNARRLSASTTMVTATISLAPEEIPRMYGPAMGLWK